MKQNIYYTQVLKRKGIADKVLDLSAWILSWPKLVLDIFLRRNMGERFFNLQLAILTGVLIYFFPPLMIRFFGHAWERDIIFYLFLTAYAIMTVIRYLEIRREPSVYDFAKYSYSSGEPYPFFYKLRVLGRNPSLRIVEIYYEPLFCFLAGVILIVISTPTGAIIILCSIAYYVTNMVAAKIGDHMILDQIDKIICNQDLSEIFAQGKERSPRGVPFYAKMPSSEELRDELADEILGDDDADEAEVR